MYIARAIDVSYAAGKYESRRFFDLTAKVVPDPFAFVFLIYIYIIRFTFHVEATDKVAELIETVKSKGMGVGLALKPGTAVEVRLALPWKRRCRIE